MFTAGSVSLLEIIFLIKQYIIIPSVLLRIARILAHTMRSLERVCYTTDAHFAMAADSFAPLSRQRCFHVVTNIARQSRRDTYSLVLAHCVDHQLHLYYVYFVFLHDNNLTLSQ